MVAGSETASRVACGQLGDPWPTRVRLCPVTTRFLVVADVAEILNISPRQVLALLNSGELPAIRVGGRGQWRIESAQVEAYIQRQYEQTRASIAQRISTDT